MLQRSFTKLRDEPFLWVGLEDSQRTGGVIPVLLGRESN